MRIDLAGWTREATQGDPRAFFALFEEADRLGFDGAWFSEFRLPGTDWPYPSPLLLAAALLARTERLRVGTSVLVAPLHQPLLLSEELAQLHFQSGGRIDVGLGRGTEAATLEALQIDVADTRARFENACTVLQARPQLPLYIAGSTAETIGFAAQRGIPLLLSLEPPEARQLAHLDAQAGDAAAGLRTASSLARYVFIGGTADAVAAQLDALWPKLYERRVYFAGKRGVPASDVPPIDIERVLREQFIHGDPAACFAQIAALRDHTGIPNLRCVFNANGLLGNDTALAGMRLFAREVLPALKAIA